MLRRNRNGRIATGLCAAVGIAICAVLISAAEGPGVAEQIARHRNLGKAFYENPTTQAEAVGEFKKALDLAPTSVRERLNYGLALLRAGKLPEGVSQLKEVQRLDPKMPHTWFNLGIYYKKSGEEALATAQFERMAKLAPDEPVVHYQLGVMYKQAGRSDDARSNSNSPQSGPAAGSPFSALQHLPPANRLKTPRASRLSALLAAENAAIAEDVDWCNGGDLRPTRRANRQAENRRFRLRRSDLSTAAGLIAIDSTGRDRPICSRGRRTASHSTVTVSHSRRAASRNSPA
jgi:Flp pilus assembly protein TadD